MRFGIVTLFPEMFGLVSKFGVVGRACDRGLLRLHLSNPRDFARDRHRTVDDRSYGGGPGMVMKPGPVVSALDALRQDLPGAQVIYLSPQGRKLDQEVVAGLAGQGELILLAGRYEGVDQRVLDHYVDQELSIGDFVLSGGELAAMVVVDAVARLIPGVLGDEQSARADSFSESLLDYPHFTRPAEFQGALVPQVLLDGDHAAVARWRRKQSLGRTELRRPDLLARCSLTETDRQLLAEYRREREAGRQE